MNPAGLTDYVIPGKATFTQELQDAHTNKFSELERRVREYRESVVKEYQDRADDLVRSFGQSGKSKVRSYNKALDLHATPAGTPVNGAL